MDRGRLGGLALCGWLVLGCDGSKDEEPHSAETGIETCPTEVTGAPALASVNTACDEGGRMRFQAETAFVAASGLLFVQGTAQPDTPEPQRAENHTLSSVQRDPCGASERLERVLDDSSHLADGDGDGQLDQVTDSSTALSCGDLEAGNLTVAFAILDASGAVSSCVVTGHDPTGLVNAVYRRITEPMFDTSSCVEGVPGQ